MQNFGIRQFGRTVLTITGIILLILFGARAASQASSLAAVGGEVKKASIPTSLHIGQLAVLSKTESVQKPSNISYSEKAIETTVSTNMVSEVTPSSSSNVLKEKAEDSVKKNIAHVEAQAASSVDAVKYTPAVHVQNDHAPGSKKLPE